MQGNLHVRFGEGDEETCLGNGARRFIPTLQGSATHQAPPKDTAVNAAPSGNKALRFAATIRLRDRAASWPWPQDRGGHPDGVCRERRP